MSDELAEEYDRLIRPELYQKADRRWKVAVAKLSLPDPHEIELAWQLRVRAHLAANDQEILQAAGLTLDDLVKVRAAKKKKRRIGQMLPQTKEKRALRKTALLAIRQADLGGSSWGDTIDFVKASCQEAHKDAEPDRKTVDAWLKALHEWGLIDIHPPKARGRGRPRKKE